MPRDSDTISQHFGPELVLDGRGGRVSFADAWRDPQLRKHALNAATRALVRERRAAGKAPSAENDRLSMIANLLLDVAMDAP